MADHGAESGHDDHAEADEHAAALGPMDVAMWGAAVLGVALGIVVFLALIFATT